MKIFSIIFFILFSVSIFANESQNNELEVINLYENKSLDQLVLENLNDENESEEIIDNINDNNETNCGVFLSLIHISEPTTPY